tara:strand:- start:1082 stop:1705 length:624 start_codon:yes stop_codon:yes gene_type:complete
MYDNCTKETLEMFNMLNSGASRADLFRICKLHYDGGIWFDADLPAFDIDKQKPNFKQLLEDNKAILVRNRKCDNPRYTFIAGLKGNNLFFMLNDFINKHIKEAAKHNKGISTIDITGPFVLHKLVLMLCGFEDVLKAGPRTFWPGGYAFSGTLSLNKNYNINGTSFMYIDDIIPEKDTYSEENAYSGYESDTSQMGVIHHGQVRGVK